MKTEERKFRTDGGAIVGELPSMSVNGVPVRIKKIVVTDEGKLQLTMEGEAIDTATMEKLKTILMIQQGDALMDLTSMQGDMLL